MVIDNRESKGWGTLLHVIKRDPNARVSSLKESIEPTPRPSNHLIAKSPKLDGNTLHIKASFLECTAILWLKWLTYSTGSVQPLYMVNVGWVNHWESLPPSILRVKGDLEIWFNALLIASFPRPLQDELLLLRLWWLSLSQEKVSLEGAFDLGLWLPSPTSSKEKSESEGVRLRRSRRNLFSDGQSPVAWPYYSLHERHGSHFKTASCQYGWYACQLPDPFFAQYWENDLDIGTLWITPDSGLNLP